MNRQNRNDNPSGKWIGLVLVLLFTQPMLAIPMAVFGGIIYFVIKAVGSSQQKTTAPKAALQEKFDECPQGIFCFHRDKGEHHVKRGREIDPWDRPDIDISKYQRRE